MQPVLDILRSQLSILNENTIRKANESESCEIITTGVSWFCVENILADGDILNGDTCDTLTSGIRGYIWIISFRRHT